MSKEQKQVLILSVLIVGIIGVVVYFNFERLVPKATGGLDLGSPTPKLQIGSAQADSLFGRSDYLNLKEFGQVPVRPTGLGSENMFKVMETETSSQ